MIVSLIYPCKFGGNPFSGSRDIVGKGIRDANADTDADTNGIRTEANMSAHVTCGGGGGGGSL